MSRTIVKQIFNKSGKMLNHDASSISLVWGKLTSCGLSKTEVVLKCDKRDNLGHTTVIMQDGLDIQELPAIVRKVKDVGLVSLHNSIIADTACATDEGDVCSGHTANASQERDESSGQVPHVRNDSETAEIMEGFSRCFTTKGVFLLLETIPDDEVNPLVAFYALRKIIELENNHQYRNAVVRGGEDMSENFTRTAVFNQLINTIASGPESYVILDALKLVSREMVGSNSVYRDKLCDEILIRVTDGKFDVVQVCEIVRLLGSSMNGEKSNEDVDKLWVGLVDKGKEITEKNIMEVFRILPFLAQSRKMVFGLLERRSRLVWWRLPGNAVAEILSILFEVKLFSPRMMTILSSWTNTNIHTVNEDDLLEIVRGFYALDYVDPGITKSLERYVKAKSSKIKNAAVLATIMDYCGRFRLRSEPILKGCESYLIEHGQSLSPLLIKEMFAPFGILNFQPSDSFKFWRVLESILDEKFVQFRPEDAIDVMLTCVYLGKFPLNFVQKIFNPNFLDRLHSYRDVNVLRQMRSKLKLFDTAMTLECTQYRGPMLPRDHSAKNLWQDGRIHRMINYISVPLANMIGGHDRITTSVILPQLPASSLYVIDVMLHPSGMGGSTIRFNFRRERNVYVAVLIHVPEHFCAGSTQLIGLQVMRKRHLRRLGMRVVELEYDKLAKLRVHPKSLEEYLAEKLKSAEDAM